MSELQPSSRTMKPPNEVQHSLKLPLQTGSVDATTFTECSILSSASSSSSASPDSMRSLSSLSNGRTDSPLDVDMAEGIIMVRKVTTGEDDSGIQSPDCRLENDNENSVSVYLDAKEESWSKIYDDQDNVTLILTHKQDPNNDRSDAQSNGDHGRRSSEDSSATEAALCCSGYEEVDNDEEEDSFLSLSSADLGMKCHDESEEAQMQSSSRCTMVEHLSVIHQENPGLPEPHSDAQGKNTAIILDLVLVSELHQERMDHHTEENQMQSSTKALDMSLVGELLQEALVESVELHTEKDPGNTFQHQVPEEPMELLTEEDQVQNSARILEVGPVRERHQGALHESMELHAEEEQMQSSMNELYQEELQKAAQLHIEEGQSQRSSRRPSVDPGYEDQEAMEFYTEEGQMQSYVERLDVSPLSLLHQDSVPEPAEPLVEISPSPAPCLSLLHLSQPKQDLENMTISSTPTVTDSPSKAKPTSQSQKYSPGQVQTRPSARTSLTKATRAEIKRFPRPDLKNVKPKVISRSSSAPRPVTASQSGAGTERKLPPTRGRPANRKEQDADGIVKKTKRSSSNQARTTVPDIKSRAIIFQVERNDARQSSEMVINDNQGQNERTMVMEVVKEEHECCNEEVNLEDLPEEIPKDIDPTNSRGSGVKTPRVVGGRTGISKMCGPASSCKPLQKAAISKLPIKSGSLPTSLSSSSLGSAASDNRGVVQVMKGEEKTVRPSCSSLSKPANNKTADLRNRANATPAKHTGQKPIRSPVKTTQNARSGSAKTNPPPAVEKSSKGVRSVNGRPYVGGGGRGGGRGGGEGGVQGVLGVPHGEEEEEKHLRLQNEKKNQCILQLRQMVAHGNRRLEALALVVQHIFTEKEEALKQKNEVSLQLKNLREELASSVSCCERERKEKEEVCVALEAAVCKLQQQHQAELAQLEDTLRDFYSAEWDKTHQAYQDEADKYRALMQQQVEEVRMKQEALRKEQKAAHTQEMEVLKQEYETALEDFRKTHENDIQELDNKRKQSEAFMNEKLERLMEENEALRERLKEEEERRKALSNKNQKDPHLLYLEQELESLKVVLEIKTSQLHQQDKKLMQMDKLVESNVKLEESLKKLQQENEDYKARMDKHAALSRQLSTEQAMLQQTLQMESKVNKRLSMENEELLWKLHNGDLSSPRRLSPSSPFHSPRNSASFPSAPISPR
ncbi:microtubule-associated tumor suppressor 1 homolog [Hoplias malabaricus]|uniref:microtubule-associated tumor suppressor 1 homolog n=1 Tax=Hoplias malabaricus TaxID=27720 RepID=UPI003462EBE7